MSWFASKDNEDLVRKLDELQMEDTLRLNNSIVRVAAHRWRRALARCPFAYSPPALPGRRSPVASCDV